MSGAGRIVALARRELGCLTHNLDRLWAVGHMPIGHRFGPGLLLGVVAARAVVTRTIGQVERLLATPVADSPDLRRWGSGATRSARTGSRCSVSRAPVGP